MKFLLDANFMLIPSKFKVDIFVELEKFGHPELYTIDLVVKELRKIIHSTGADARAARLGLKLIYEHNVDIIEAKEDNADNDLIRLSKEGFIVCTQDKEIIDKIHSNSGQIIHLRQKKYLEKV
ncbi:MAG: hypothetical protein KJ613_04025 [Nanoarchaeota archaeon]|nr:hypothetical protein [Nanoarchaeota archaeon]MBU1134948.1 hypothetical protein [Nanoarchaeota archaeon]